MSVVELAAIVSALAASDVRVMMEDGDWMCGICGDYNGDHDDCCPYPHATTWAESGGSA